MQATAPYLGRQVLCFTCALSSNLYPDQPISRAQTTVTLVNIRGHARSGADGIPGAAGTPEPNAYSLKKGTHSGGGNHDEITSAVNDTQYAASCRHRLSDPAAPIWRPAQANMTAHGGPVMVNQVKTYLIYWTPSGVVLDSSVTDKTGNFRNLSQQFYGDVSGSGYMNIVTQYPGTCSGSPCVLSNGADAVKNISVWVDTQAYPHPGVNNDSGTQANPLTDADIQNEVTRAISQNHWTADANSIFFVITGIFSSNGKLIEECDSTGANCTFKGAAFCGYHGQFSSTFYSFLSDASFARGGCDEGITTAVNTQIASDREVALMTHEFIETVTDPQLNEWFDSAGNEIGDLCNQIPGEVTMNGHTYAVQQQWSNASSSCVLEVLDVATIIPVIFAPADIVTITADIVTIPIENN